VGLSKPGARLGTAKSRRKPKVPAPPALTDVQYGARSCQQPFRLVPVYFTLELAVRAFALDASREQLKIVSRGSTVLITPFRRFTAPLQRGRGWSHMPLWPQPVAKARIGYLETQDRKKADRDDTRRKIILGGQLLSLAEREPSRFVSLVEELIGRLERDPEQRMFVGWNLPTPPAKPQSEGKGEAKP
jgi:hypothetical protein